MKRSRIDFKSGEVGDNVAVPVPLVDRGRGDARNILGVILNRDISRHIHYWGEIWCAKRGLFPKSV